MTIWKYPIGVIDEQEISVPEGAVALCVQMQEGVPCIWYQIDAHQDEVHRLSVVVGTGREFDSRNTKYIGTVQMAAGALVWHVFEEASK